MNRFCATIIAAAVMFPHAPQRASAQTPVTVTNWGSPVTVVGGGKPNGPAMLDANGQLPAVNLGTALTGYVKADGSTPASFLQLTCMTTAQVKALSASDGAVACVNDLGSAGSHYSNIVVRVGGGWTQISWGSSL